MLFALGALKFRNEQLMPYTDTNTRLQWPDSDVFSDYVDFFGASVSYLPMLLHAE